MTLALRVAEEHLGIPSLVSAADLADARADEQSVVNYVCMLVSAAKTKHMSHAQREQEVSFSLTSLFSPSLSPSLSFSLSLSLTHTHTHTHTDTRSLSDTHSRYCVVFLISVWVGFHLAMSVPSTRSIRFVPLLVCLMSGGGSQGEDGRGEEAV